MANSYNVRCLDVHGKIQVFSIQDAPALITSDTFVLMLKPNSPILHYCNFTRGSDIPDLFEGDIVECGGKEYIIQYSRGFKAIAEDKEMLFLNQLHDYKHVGTIYDREFPVKIQQVNSLTYKYKDELIFIHRIVAPYVGEKLLVLGNNEAVPASSIQQYAGLNYMGNKVFFGDTISGSTVTMHGGRIVIVSQKGYYDLVEKRYLVEGEYCLY